VRLSTSNSEKTPARNRDQWLLTLVLLGFLVLATEIYWRRGDFLTNVVDGRVLWSMHRDDVYGDNKLVVLGGSRAQIGIDLAKLATSFPDHDIVQLSLVRVTPYAILKDLASDPDFAGTIICSMTAPWLLPRNRGDTSQWVRYYREEYPRSRTWQIAFNRTVASYLQDNLVILAPELRLAALFENDLDPSSSYFHMKISRARPTYYRTRMSTGRLNYLRRRRMERSAKDTRATLRARRQSFRRAVSGDLRQMNRALQERGGRLIMLRMPTSGPRWPYDEEMFPRRQFWNTIQKTSGVETVHFKDYSGLSGFDCPDYSHLDAHDIGRFTSNLGRILKGIMASNLPSPGASTGKKVAGDR